jgi:hypothetical protein
VLFCVYQQRIQGFKLQGVAVIILYKASAAAIPIAATGCAEGICAIGASLQQQVAT